MPMGGSSSFLRWLTLQDVRADLLHAQHAQVRSDVPLLIGLAIVSSAVMAGAVAGALPATASLVAVAALYALPRLFRRSGTVLPRQASTDRARRDLRRLLLSVLVVGLFQIPAVALVYRSGGFDPPAAEILTVSIMVAAVCCVSYLMQAVALIGILILCGTVGHVALNGLGDFGSLLPSVVASMVVVGHIVIRDYRNFDALIRVQALQAIDQENHARLSAENARLANLDALTGLPNRRYFLRQIDMMTAGTDEDGECPPFAVGLIDLDRFKPVNDLYGHVVGDRLLAELGQRLLAINDDRLVIARLGGDEFGILFANVDESAQTIGERICAIAGEAYRIDDFHLSVGCSCGIALFPQAGRSAREIFDRADYALYHAKRERDVRCVVFSGEHEERIRSSQILDAALLTADPELEMTLHFQPIVDVHAMKVVAVEALARWDSPVLGPVSPARFIPAAEALGMIGTLSVVLFAKALAGAALLPADITLSFNLSAIDIATPATTEAIIAQIEASRIDPRRVTIEITETAVIRNFDEAVATIERLRALGCRVALDDFGTGFSSLTHLRRLPLDAVKVDGGFVSGLGDAHGRKVVAAIASLCRTLDIACVIEGIETEEQLLRVRQFGYRNAQGYLFAPGMPMDELLDWLVEWDAHQDPIASRAPLSAIASRR